MSRSPTFIPVCFSSIAMLSAFPPTPVGSRFTTVEPLAAYFATSLSFAFASMIDSSPTFLNFGEKIITAASERTCETGLSPISISSPTSSWTVLWAFTIPGSRSIAIWSVSSTMVTEATPFSMRRAATEYPSLVRP